MINGTVFGISVLDKFLVAITSSPLFGFNSVLDAGVTLFRFFNSLFLLI